MVQLRKNKIEDRLNDKRDNENKSHWENDKKSVIANKKEEGQNSCLANTDINDEGLADFLDHSLHPPPHPQQQPQSPTTQNTTATKRGTPQNVQN